MLEIDADALAQSHFGQVSDIVSCCLARPTAFGHVVSKKLWNATTVDRLHVGYAGDFLHVSRQFLAAKLVCQDSSCLSRYLNVRSIATSTNLGRLAMIERREFYIDGQWVGPNTTRDHQVISPADEQPCAVISLGSDEDVNLAVAAAKRAFPGWMATPYSERIALVEKLLEIYVERGEEMAQAMSGEMGAPVDLARGPQYGSGEGNIRGMIEAAKNFEFEEAFDPDRPEYQILNEPVGVCALITPWNWPMNQVTLKVAAAAIAGCTMVLKPSEESPLNAMLFAEFMDAAGFPAGVFNLVNGDGVGVGAALSKHPDVDMVSFTGSTRAGREIIKASADGIKRISLELGGKSANIVFPDADEDAIERGVMAVMINSGQSCDAPTRMLVHRDIYDKAVETAANVMSKVDVGQPGAEGDHIGPVINESQFNRIQKLIQKGMDEGARLVVGGPGRPENFNSGYYVRPTLFADANNKMTIARTEVFGPVLTMIPFDSEEEAVEVANDTEYGLSSYVQTQDKDRANRIARQMRAGMVNVNGVPRAVGSPFGGYKQSGIGREGGRWGIEDFLQVKSVAGWAQ